MCRQRQVGEQGHRLPSLECDRYAVAHDARGAQQRDFQAHGVTIAALAHISSRFFVRNANRTRLRESVPMNSVAASSVSPWTARLPWVLLAITVATMRAFIATQQPGNVSLWLREGSL